MSGALLLLAAGGPLYAGTITIGDDGGDDYGFLSGSYGSISPNTYKDRSGTTRTITSLNWDDTTNTLSLGLSGTVSNDDAAFSRLVLGTNVYVRSDATYTNPSASIWRWDTGGTNPIGTSGTRAAVLV